MRGVFVTGTDTRAGKSVVAAAICAALAARVEPVGALRPAVTGLDEPAGDWSYDHVLLARAAGKRQAPEDVAPYRFGPAVSPHYAAELAGEAIEPARILAAARRQIERANRETIERLGGVPVHGLPPTDPYSLAAAGRSLPLGDWL